MSTTLPRCVVSVPSLMCVHVYSCPCPMLADNGELFTWGRAGPYLGYCVEEGNKQLRPRRVMDLENHKVTQVACGCAHTIGKGMACSPSLPLSLSVSVCIQVSFFQLDLRTIRCYHFGLMR